MLPREAQLAAAYARGKAAFPALVLDRAAFTAHLVRVGAVGAVGGVGEKEAEVAVSAELAVEDLFLACACALRVEGAAAAFSEKHGQAVRNGIARIIQGSDLAEVEQRLMDVLLVGTLESPAKIGTYAGRAPLDRWLGVAAQRTALMWLREDRVEGRARVAAAAEPVVGGDTHPELSYLKERYRADFQRALADALGRAPARERALLRLHLVNGLSVEKIGKMFGVSQPTASRMLARARESLLADIKASLLDRLGISSDEVASLAGLVASRIDLSLSILLRTG